VSSLTQTCGPCRVLEAVSWVSSGKQKGSSEWLPVEERGWARSHQAQDTAHPLALLTQEE
jgi:hypothetical protein